MRFGWLVLIVIVIGGFIFRNDIGKLVRGTQAAETKTSGRDKNAAPGEAAEGIRVAEQWNMPKALKEISGIAYMDGERFACIQDEQGVIYVFNRHTNNIEKEISFAGRGDFEDIALVGETAWVVRSDGTLFEVDLTSSKPEGKPYRTPLTAAQNIEGLAYDQAHNRLLVAIKDEEPGGGDYKGIYGFDLATKTLATEPVYKIDTRHEVFAGDEGKKAKVIKPSAIAIHPGTGDLYLTDGPRSRLLVMDKAGRIKDLLKLGKTFEQPEGLAFSPAGEMFISNEGNKQPGNIIQVSLP